MSVSRNLKLTAASPGFFKSLLQMVDRRDESTEKKLWNNHDPRIDVALFQSNVPTLIINQDQRFLDWNTAFEMVFNEITLKKGMPIGSWYEHLDNFKNVPKRIEKLYGEGVLPITDRERVTFVSKKYGRMVFTKIMSPILDRLNGKIIGWTIVLNINSVSKRLQFFEELYQNIETREKFLRYTSSYDQIFSQLDTHEALVKFHVENLASATRVVEFGSLGGEITQHLLLHGKKVWSLDEQPDILRRINDKCIRFLARLKLIKRSLDKVEDIPLHKFDGISIALSIQDFTNFEVTLQKLIPQIAPGTTLVLSTWLPETDMEKVAVEIRTELSGKNRMSELKYFYNHVVEFLQKNFLAKKSRLLGESKLFEMLDQAAKKETFKSRYFFNGQVLGIVIKI